MEVTGNSLSSLYGRFYTVSEETTFDAINRIAHKVGREPNGFYHLRIDEIVRRVTEWRDKLPRVEPHYAVKCNDHLAVIRTFALMGLGFDCASRAEMKRVMACGVDASRIIYANPAKASGHIKHAQSVGVSRMTFDSSAELLKIKELYPAAEMVIRIRCDAAEVQCELGIKFGVQPDEARPLLSYAAQLGLKVVGVAFHVGSGCAEPSVFLRAIRAARMVFDEAKEEGHNPTLLDIGGGYLGGKKDSLDEAAGYINTALEEHFPLDCGVRIIAEPGRFMVASAFTLATPVISQKSARVALSELPCSLQQQFGSSAETGKVDTSMLFIDDGVYGSFNCILYDHQVVTPLPLKSEQDSDERISSVWGPTCDGFDQVIKAAALPAGLTVGDWLVWEDMGAYTLSAAGKFNGFSQKSVKVHMTNKTRVFLESLLAMQQKTSEGSDKMSEGYSSGAISEEECLSSSKCSTRPESPLSDTSSPPAEEQDGLTTASEFSSDQVIAEAAQKILKDQQLASNDKDMRTAAVDALFGF